MSTLVPKIKYLTNKDLLAAIHESKNTFCEFEEPRYANYDIIAHSLDSVSIEMLEAARQKRLSDLQAEEKRESRSKVFESKLSIEEIPLESIVVRLMTFDHIPINPAKVDRAKTEAERHIRCQFPPFQHYIWKNNSWHCVGRSHWKNGEFSLYHGRVTNRLGAMWMKLVERYGHRGNWRGYCVDTATEALTDRGWLGIDEISEDDQILSYNDGQMTWSPIKSIYRGHYEGLMHRLTVTGMDALITPNHKLVTARGLVPAELLLESDQVILMGESAPDGQNEFSNSLVELMGWIVTEGCYETDHQGIKRITVYQNQGAKGDRIRHCLQNLDFKFSESVNPKGNICFGISRHDSRKIYQLMPKKNLTMEIINSLTHDQRHLLINTMIDGDGWRSGKNMRYVQKSKDGIDMFQALCALAGLKTNSHLLKDRTAFGKTTDIYQVNIFSPSRKKTRGECINMHGGKRNGRGKIGKGKASHPNEPTTPYNGMVWCPQTEYGCFLARRNGKVYLTGNTYLDEMRAQALVQLSQVGLQFDESKSSNPFAYYTQCVSTSFLKILTNEKKSQTIRDDLLIMHGATPSHTRQVEDQIAQQQQQLLAESATGPVTP